jgi:hypothetical protein
MKVIVTKSSGEKINIHCKDNSTGLELQRAIWERTQGKITKIFYLTTDYDQIHFYFTK